MCVPYKFHLYYFNINWIFIHPDNIIRWTKANSIVEKRVQALFFLEFVFRCNFLQQ